MEISTSSSDRTPFPVQNADCSFRVVVDPSDIRSSMLNGDHRWFTVYLDLRAVRYSAEYKRAAIQRGC